MTLQPHLENLQSEVLMEENQHIRVTQKMQNFIFFVTIFPEDQSSLEIITQITLIIQSELNELIAIKLCD